MMTSPRFNFLIVDDYPLMRQALSATIRAGFLGARVEEAGDTTEALAYCHSLNFDLITLDLRLGRESGLHLARRLVQSGKNPKILIVAAETEPSVIREALAIGVVGYIDKTCSGPVFLQAARKILAGERCLCPEAQRALENRAACSLDAWDRTGNRLSPREREVLKCLASGESTKSAAFLMNISPKTVETHRQHIMQKLRLACVSDLTRYAIREGLIAA